MSIADAPVVVPPDTSESIDVMDLIAPYVDDSDPLRRTHIVRPGDNDHIRNDLPNGRSLTGQDIVDYGRMNGVEVVALCGYRWVPKHNPEKFETCEPCLKVVELIQSGRIV